MESWRYESLRKNISDFGIEAVKRVRVATHVNLEPAECYVIYNWDDRFCCRVPFHFSLPEMLRIEGEYSQIYGRTPWGRWSVVTLKNFRIIKIRVVEDPESNERIQYLLQYFNDFEER